MKKLTSILILAAMLLSVFSGCSNTGSVSSKAEAGAAAGESSSEKQQSSEAENTEPAKLTIIARGGSHVDVINAVKGKFEEENNCKIEVLGLESDELKQKIQLDAANQKGAYDLAMSDDPWMPEFADSKIFKDLSKMGYEGDSDFVEKCLDIGKVPYGTGDVYALPFAGNVQFFFYNKALLQQLKVEVPTDWASVLKIAKAAKASGKVGYVIRGQQGNPVVTDYLPILWAYGGDVFDKDWNVTVDSQAGKDSLNFYLELLKNGANYEKDDIVAAVKDGSAAMSLGWPSWYISNKGAAAAYAVIPGKKDSSSKEYPAAEIGNWMMGVTANSQNPELAMKLLIYLTSAEAQKAGADVGGVPTRTSVLTDPDLLKKYPYFKELLEGTKSSVVRPRTPKWSDVETAYGTELSNAVAGSKSVDQALSDAKTAIEKIMK